MVKDWPVNEAYEQFIRALLVLKEVHGDEEATRILQQEATREAVIRKLRPAARAIAAPSADANAARHLAVAADALAFYADDGNWPKTAGARGSAAHRDKGARARDALAEIAGEGESE